MKTITYIRAMKVMGVGFSCLLSLSLSAQTHECLGPNNGTVFQNSYINGSEVAWANVQNAQYADGIFASAGPLSSTDKKTDYLIVTGFNFTLASTYTVTGIEVIVNRTSSDPQTTKDNKVNLVKNGVVIGKDNSFNANWNVLSTTIVKYGDDGDLWNVSWTPDDINAANFGVAFSAMKKGGGSTNVNVFVDQIQIKVHYNGPNYVPPAVWKSAAPIITNTCEELPSFSVFPNPATDGKFSLMFEQAPPCDVLVMLYDIMGREQYAKVTVNANSASFIEAIECDKKLAPGMYLIVATNRDEMYKQILVMR